MNGADYLIIGILVASVLLGLLRGFLRESIALLTWVGALWLAWRFAHLIEPHLGGLLARQPARVWAARAIIFLAVYILGSGIGALAAYLVRGSALSMVIDRLLGLGFGLIKGAVIVSILVIVGELVHLDDVRWWERSKFMPYAVEVAGWMRAFAESGAAHLEDQSLTEG